MYFGVPSNAGKHGDLQQIISRMLPSAQSVSYTQMYNSKLDSTQGRITGAMLDGCLPIKDGRLFSKMYYTEYAQKVVAGEVKVAAQVTRIVTTGGGGGEGGEGGEGEGGGGGLGTRLARKVTELIHTHTVREKGVEYRITIVRHII